MDVTDQGQGGEDLILVRETTAPCADNPEDEQMDDPEALLRLGRGKVTIHDDEEAAPPAARLASAAGFARIAR